MRHSILHSARLENLVGQVHCEVVRQTTDMRMVHLRDGSGHSQTLAIVRFHTFENDCLQHAHDRIRAGSLLGQTLQENGIDFVKNAVGSFEIALPEWLQVAFGTTANTSLAICSAIHVRPGNQSDIHYADIIEIIPPGLRIHFKDRIALEEIVPEAFHHLNRFAGLDVAHQNDTTMKRSIVIGAGPGGLVAVKELLENGLRSVICLEQSGEIGGIFSRGYDNLILTSSVTFSMFSDYWVGDGKDHHFWSKEEAVSYWKDYARHYGVLEHIRFHTKVQSVMDRPGGPWRGPAIRGRIGMRAPDSCSRQ